LPGLDEPRAAIYQSLFNQGRPVAEEIAKRFPATALLAVVALVFSIILSVSAAVLSAAFYDKSPTESFAF
jgi:ABC-type dipeptide/oligopeptide/nickel transport system permease component